MRLEQEGLLQALPGGGYAVRVFSEREVADAIEGVAPVARAFVVGSALVGGFDPATSDLDVVVVVERTLEQEEREAVVAELPADPGAGDHQHRVMTGLPVPGPQVGERRADAPRGRGDEVGELDDPHPAALATSTSGASRRPADRASS